MLREVLVPIQQPPPPQTSSASFLLSSSSPPFLLIIISVLNFQKHTRRENVTVLPEQLSLCFQTAYYHQNGWIFSLSPKFFPLAKFLSLSPPYLMDFRQLQSTQKWRRRAHGGTQCVWRILTRCGSPRLLPRRAVCARTHAGVHVAT